MVVVEDYIPFLSAKKLITFYLPSTIHYANFLLTLFVYDVYRQRLSLFLTALVQSYLPPYYYYSS